MHASRKAQQCDYRVTQIATAACERGHVAILEWLRQRVGDPQLAAVEPRFVSAPAAFNGQVHMLEHLHDKGYLNVEWAMTFAAEGSQTAALQWLVDEGHPWNHLISYYAVQGGSVATLQWLQDQGCPMRHPQSMCRAGIRFLRLDALKWLQQHDIGGWTLRDLGRMIRSWQFNPRRLSDDGIAVGTWLQSRMAAASAAHLAAAAGGM